MKNIFKKYRKAKGFTLVELLIVIIIIGILAGMMMLSAGAATDKAEATKIVSNMRNIKAATIMYYADNGDWPETDVNKVSQYLGASVDTTVYGLVSGGTASDDYSVEAKGIASGVQKKLGDMANQASLFKEAVGTNGYTSGENVVYMVISKK